MFQKYRVLKVNQPKPTTRAAVPKLFGQRLRELWFLLQRFDQSVRPVIARVCRKLNQVGRCQLCLEPTRSAMDLCDHCIAVLPPNAPACRRCARVFSSVSERSGSAIGPAGTCRDSTDEKDSDLCGRCQRQVVVIRHTLAYARYEWPVDVMIRQLKYGKKMHFARTMGLLMSSQLARAGTPSVDVLIPIPLAVPRWRTRGFNQAEEIARPLAKRLGLALDCQLLVRHRQTNTQAGLSKRQRKENIRGCFSCTAAVLPKRYVLIDDVMTTGATAHEAAKTLLAAGAVSVDIWVFARTP